MTPGQVFGAYIAVWVIATQLFFIQQLLKRIAAALEKLVDKKHIVNVDVLR